MIEGSDLATASNPLSVPQVDGGEVRVAVIGREIAGSLPTRSPTDGIFSAVVAGGRSTYGAEEGVGSTETRKPTASTRSRSKLMSMPARTSRRSSPHSGDCAGSSSLRIRSPAARDRASDGRQTPREIRARQRRGARRLRTPGSHGFSQTETCLRAVARERLPVPAAPALAQAHPGQLRHEVELRGPGVAERNREALEPSVDDPEVMGREALRRDVVLVDPPARLAHDGRREWSRRAEAAGARGRRPR